MRPAQQLVAQLCQPAGLVGHGQRRGGLAPLDHRAGVELHVGLAQHFRQHEPVGGRPVAGVAEGHGGLAGPRVQGRGLGGQLRLVHQRGAAGLEEQVAVEVDGARQRAGGLGRAVRLAALKERRRPRIDQHRALAVQVAFHVVLRGQPLVAEAGLPAAGGHAGRLRRHRQAGGLPGVQPAVEDRQLAHPQALECPVHPRGRAEVGRIDAGVDDDGVRLGRQAELLHQGRQLLHRRQLAGVGGRAAPAAVGRRHGPGQVLQRVGRAFARVDDAHRARQAQRLQLGRCQQRRRGPGRGRQQRAGQPGDEKRDQGSHATKPARQISKA